jgi:hypothetical protein
MTERTLEEVLVAIMIGYEIFDDCGTSCVSPICGWKALGLVAAAMAGRRTDLMQRVGQMPGVGGGAVRDAEGRTLGALSSV